MSEQVPTKERVLLGRYAVERVERPAVKSGRQLKWPFKALEPGDSVFIPLVDTTPNNTEYDNVQSAMTYYARTYHRTYSLRSEDGGVRVWRTK